MKRLLTGIQPSGELHIGNYLGAIKQIVDLQKEYECFVMVADLHALASPHDPKTFSDQTISVITTLLASGLDPAKTTIFVQSAILEHAQLAWIFNTLTPIGELERMTQYKEKSDKHGQNAGLLTYPVLQAADILLYHPEVVPVGEDQIQHLELTRMIVRKFNNKYGQTFFEPKTLLTKSARIMALNDPSKKMSKSVSGSYVAIDDDTEMIRKKIMSAVTDEKPSSEMSPGVKNLFTLLEGFAPDQVKKFEKQYRDSVLKYFELKSVLADAIINTLAPVKEKKKELLSNKKGLLDLISKHNLKAKEVATQTLSTIYENIGLLK